MKFRFVILVVGILSIGCSDKENEKPVENPASATLLQAPDGFPEIPFPDDNAFTMSRWELGRKLFYDPILSIDSSISCGSCHQQALAFSDAVAFSDGVNGEKGTRNAPSLANVAYHPYYTREGGVPTLEMQVLVPIQEHNEFNANIVVLSEKLNQNNLYVTQSMKAYNRAPDPFVITRALATFERTLISGNSPYDRYKQHGASIEMSDEAMRGMDLFFGDKTNCSSCHSGFNFTNYAFENNGLYPVYSDKGRYRLTGEAEDIGLFKVPSLRNIALTAPYMHDGSIATLEEVVAHYVSGGTDHENKSPEIHSLALSEAEQSDIVQFLVSLTDEEFISNSIFAAQE